MKQLVRKAKSSDSGFTSIEPIGLVRATTRTFFLLLFAEILVVLYTVPALFTSKDSAILNLASVIRIPSIGLDLSFDGAFRFVPVILLCFHWVVLRANRNVADVSGLLDQPDAHFHSGALRSAMAPFGIYGPQVLRMRARAERIAFLEGLVSGMALWAMVPFALVFVWLRYLPFRIWPVSVVHCCMITLAVVVSWINWRASKDPRRRSGRGPCHWGVCTGIAALLAASLLALTYVAHGGSRSYQYGRMAFAGGDGYSKRSDLWEGLKGKRRAVWEIMPRAMEKCRLHDFVVMEHEIVSEIPNPWAEAGANRRGGLDFTCRDLRFLYATDCAVVSCNFSGANLEGCDLRSCDLRGSCFFGAKLAGSTVSGCNLQGSSFTGVNLSGVMMAGSDLLGADFTGASLPDIRNMKSNYNWQYAIYDPEGLAKLGLPSDNRIRASAEARRAGVGSAVGP